MHCKPLPPPSSLLPPPCPAMLPTFQDVQHFLHNGLDILRGFSSNSEYVNPGSQYLSELGLGQTRQLWWRLVMDWCTVFICWSPFLHTHVPAVEVPSPIVWLPCPPSPSGWRRPRPAVCYPSPPSCRSVAGRDPGVNSATGYCMHSGGSAPGQLGSVLGLKNN